MSLNSSLFGKLLQSVLAVSERERVCDDGIYACRYDQFCTPEICAKHMVRIVKSVREEIVVHVSATAVQRG